MYFHSAKFFQDRLHLNYQPHFTCSFNSIVWGSLPLAPFPISLVTFCPVIIFLLRVFSIMKLAELMSYKSQIKKKRKEKKQQSLK